MLWIQVHFKQSAVACTYSSVLFYHLCTQIHLFRVLLSFNLIHFGFPYVILLMAAPRGYRMAVEQTVIHRIEIKTRASIFSALGSVVNCRSSEERHLRVPDNAAGPLRWLMISSLLFQQSGIGVEGDFLLYR